MNVNDDRQLVITRLEEEMLDVAEQKVCRQSSQTLPSGSFADYSTYQLCCRSGHSIANRFDELPVRLEQYACCQGQAGFERRPVCGVFVLERQMRSFSM